MDASNPEKPEKQGKQGKQGKTETERLFPIQS